MVNATVVTATTALQSDILIEEGCIAAIGKNINRTGIPAEQIIDADGCYVMPGGIDVHTHCNLSVGSEQVSDGFYHASVAAAYGGTTSIVEHPGFGPDGCTLHFQTDLYRKQAATEMVIDYGFHGVIQHVDDKVLSSMKGMVADGIPTFKVYLTYSGRLDDGEIIRVLKANSRAGGITAFHAENHAIISSLSKTLSRTARVSDPAIHPLSRPDYCEAEAIHRIIALARAAGDVPIYIVHLSTASGLEVVRAARKGGFPVYVETCPQYLVLTESCYRDSADREGLQYIMAPPLRSQRDCDALWDGLADGSIDVVATDHCSFSFEQKCRQGRDNVFAAPGGIPGIETRVPVLFSEGVLKRRIGLNRFVQLIATNPARIMGLTAKGDLAVGADADLLILDPEEEKVLTTETLHQQVDYTPFAGMRVTGWPRTVLLRGKVIIHRGVLTASAGCGKYISRSISSPHKKTP